MIMNKLREVGGSHYEDLDIEPVTIISQYKLNWFQGEAFKYVSRFFRKNGLSDLKKSAHVCEMALTMDKYPNVYKGVIYLEDTLLSKYVLQFKNSFREPKSFPIFQDIVLSILNKDYSKAFHNISLLMYSEYDESII